MRTDRVHALSRVTSDVSQHLHVSFRALCCRCMSLERMYVIFANACITKSSADVLELCQYL